MAYDVELADRLREILAGEPDVVEKRMFGGLAFLIGGHLAVAAGSRGGLMFRATPEPAAVLAEDPRIGPFVMRGREMRGWFLVEVDGSTSDDELAGWVDHGVRFAQDLPPK